MSGFYDQYKAQCLGTGLNLMTSALRIVLVTSGYTFSSAHEFLSEVAAGVRVATSAPLTGKSVTGGVFDAADVTFTALSGSTVTAFVLYHDTGTEGTSRLIAHVDKGGGLPYTPMGTDKDVVFSPQGVFAL